MWNLFLNGGSWLTNEPKTRNLSAGHLESGHPWCRAAVAGALVSKWQSWSFEGHCPCEQLASGWKESYSTYIKNGSPLRGEGPQSDDLHWADQVFQIVYIQLCLIIFLLSSQISHKSNLKTCFAQYFQYCFPSHCDYVWNKENNKNETKTLVLYWLMFSLLLSTREWAVRFLCNSSNFLNCSFFFSNSHLWFIPPKSTRCNGIRFQRENELHIYFFPLLLSIWKYNYI